MEPAPQTTTLHTSGRGSARSQRMLAWAGPISHRPELDSAVLHLAPIARETPLAFGAGVGADFVGLTPQGLVRSWSEHDGEISLTSALREQPRASSTRSWSASSSSPRARG